MKKEILDELEVRDFKNNKVIQNLYNENLLIEGVIGKECEFPNLSTFLQNLQLQKNEFTPGQVEIMEKTVHKNSPKTTKNI